MLRSKYSEDDLRPLLVNEVMSKDNGDPFPPLKEYVLLELFCCNRIVLTSTSSTHSTLSSQVEKLKIKYEQALDLAKNNDPSSNDKFKTLWNGKIRKADSKINHFV